MKTITQENDWINSKTSLPPKNTRVIGFFPRGDEGGDRVSTAITYDGETLRSDFPNSTAHCFVASHWMPFPTSYPETK